jgi:hypothetical protein
LLLDIPISPLFPAIINLPFVYITLLRSVVVNLVSSSQIIPLVEETRVPFLPTATKLGKITKEQKLINIGREKLINIGFNEIVSYSLNDKNTLKHVKLLNPLSNEYTSLRKSIYNNLIETIIFNRNQRNNYFSFFEIGRQLNSPRHVPPYHRLLHQAPDGPARADPPLHVPRLQGPGARPVCLGDHRR